MSDVNPQEELLTTPTAYIGLGASAGGLRPLEAFFDATTTNTGMAFIVIVHLAPDSESAMATLLGRRTRMPVAQVTDGIKVMPDHVYVIPPGQQLFMREGHLILLPRVPDAPVHVIDDFLTSLAESAGDRCAAIIFSGTGRDGSQGIHSVHDVGGLVLAQSERSARFSGMPLNAMATGIVDQSCKPSEMPAVLMDWQASEHQVGDLPSYEVLNQLLIKRANMDLRHYKPGTISRRMRKRMLKRGVGALSDYLKVVQEDPQELELLRRELLIGVTSFFRDPEVFKHLNEHLSALFDIAGEREFRVWVPGCCTGEEAYTIAILIREIAVQRQSSPTIRIFATDVNKESLEVARRGRYTDTDAIPSELRSRYFTQEADSWLVTAELRSMLVFAPHDLLRDPPFRHLFLVSCRNVLIYFEQSAQRDVFSSLAFSLEQEGMLMLGRSESSTLVSDSFESIKHGLHRRTGPQLRRAATRWRTQTLPTFQRPRQDSSARFQHFLQEELPPLIIVNSSLELVHSTPAASQFLQVQPGTPSTHLKSLMPHLLRVSALGAIQRLDQDEKQLIGAPITARRIHDATNKHYYILRFNVPDPSKEVAEPEQTPDSSETIRYITQLEGDLSTTREQLQYTMEQLETSYEELQASNEELISSNEELQSSNEELMSMNEELHTLNAELQRSIDELRINNEDLRQFFQAAAAEILILDLNLAIRRFSPGLTHCFNLRPEDIGEPISRYRPQIGGDLLPAVFAEVLEAGLVGLQHGDVFERQQYTLTIDRQAVLEGLDAEQEGRAVGLDLLLKQLSTLQHLREDRRE